MILSSSKKSRSPGILVNLLNMSKSMKCACRSSLLSSMGLLLNCRMIMFVGAERLLKPALAHYHNDKWFGN